jgi:hypothetical protein
MIRGFHRLHRFDEGMIRRFTDYTDSMKRDDPQIPQITQISMRRDDPQIPQIGIDFGINKVSGPEIGPLQLRLLKSA